MVDLKRHHRSEGVKACGRSGYIHFRASATAVSSALILFFLVHSTSFVPTVWLGWLAGVAQTVVMSVAVRSPAVTDPWAVVRSQGLRQ